MKKPFETLPRGLGLRQRQRADGSWRLWWEPSPVAVAAGAKPVELDATRPTWSKREAERLKAGTASKPTGKRSSGGRTVAALIEQYRRSPRFNRLSPSTQAGYAADFARIERKWGTQAVARFDKSVVYTWYETLHASAPTNAGKIVRSFSVLFTYAELIGWRPENSNPCRKLGVDPVAKRSRFASWAEYDSLIATAVKMGRPSMACAIALATLAGSRQKDIVEAQLDAFQTVALSGMESMMVWAFQRSKRSNAALIPVHPEAKPLVLDQIAAARRANLSARTDARRVHLIVNDATGRPYASDNFRHHFEEVRTAAAEDMPSLLSPVLQFRDLRRTFGVLARAGGADKADVGDVLGNSIASNWSLGEVYTPAQIETASRAVAAIQRPARTRKAM